MDCKSISGGKQRTKALISPRRLVCTFVMLQDDIVHNVIRSPLWCSGYIISIANQGLRLRSPGFTSLLVAT